MISPCLIFKILFVSLTATSHISNINAFPDESGYVISNGTLHDVHNLGKYVASIQFKVSSGQDEHFGWHHFCGGAIIGKTKILTAAHCLLDKFGKLIKPQRIIVVIGLRNRFKRTNTTFVKEVASVGYNRNYGRDHTFRDDIGYIILKEEIFNNSATGIIELADKLSEQNLRCTAMGWGRLFDNGPTSAFVTFVDVRIISRSYCKRRYSLALTPGMLCAADPNDWTKDPCTGDSGGPLICNEKLVGVVSWGVGCGTPYLPGVYTDVYFYRSWIQRNKGCLHLVNHAILILLLIILVV